MKFIIPPIPTLEKEEDRYTAKWMAECLYWYCRLGWYIGD